MSIYVAVRLTVSFLARVFIFASLMVGPMLLGDLITSHL